MIGTFSEDGIHFNYPTNWTLEREQTDSGWSVSVQSPGTAFMLLSLHADEPSVDDVIEAAMSALRDDYPELDVEEIADHLADRPAVGRDVQFFSLDLPNTCWIRAFQAEPGTVLVFCQTSDLEAEQTEPVLRAMRASLRLDA